MNDEQIRNIVGGVSALIVLASQARWRIAADDSGKLVRNLKVQKLRF